MCTRTVSSASCPPPWKDSTEQGLCNIHQELRYLAALWKENNFQVTSGEVKKSSEMVNWMFTERIREVGALGKTRWNKASSYNLMKDFTIPLLLNLLHIHLLYLSVVWVWVCTCAHACMCMCPPTSGGQRTPGGSQFSTCKLGSRDWTEVLRVDSKHFHLLNLLTSTTNHLLSHFWWEKLVSL